MYPEDIILSEFRSFGHLFAYLRRQAGYTQAELAAAASRHSPASMDQSTISDWERGHVTNPRQDTLDAASQALWKRGVRVSGTWLAEAVEYYSMLPDGADLLFQHLASRVSRYPLTARLAIYRLFEAILDLLDLLRREA